MTGLLLLAALHAASPPAPAPALESIRQRIQASDFRASGRLVRVAGPQRTTWKFTVRGHWFPDGLHLLYDITAPADSGAAKKLTRTLVVVDPHGRVSTRQETPLPGLFFEDLAESQFLWPTQTVAGSDSIGGRPCTNLRSQPAPGNPSRYSFVLSCVDPATALPLHAAKTIKATSQVEDFSYGNLRQDSGVWVAAQVTIQIPGQPGSTLVLLDRGTPHAHLTARDFDLAQPPPAEENQP